MFVAIADQIAVAEKGEEGGHWGWRARHRIDDGFCEGWEFIGDTEFTHDV